jgi:hypothetical protein
MIRWVLICLLLAGLVPRAYALTPGKALTQYSATVWSQQQGLPQDTIRAITNYRRLSLAGHR